MSEEQVRTDRNGRRKYAPFVVQPLSQIRYFGLFNILWIFISAAILQIVGFLLKESILSVALLANVEPDLTKSLLSLSQKFFYVAILCVVVSGIFSMFHSVWYSHRIFGPLVPARRFIDSLRAGDYSARLRFREKDEMKDIMQMLNELAQDLERRHGKSQS